MLKPVSTTVGACAIGLASMGSGFSTEARDVFSATSKVAVRAESSVSLFGSKNALISQLLALANECSSEDWDGEGAPALLPDAVRNTMAFIRAVPDGLSLPEIAPEPDGSVSLDWMRSRHRMLSISVGSSNKFAFARMNGTDRIYGVFAFDGQSISKLIQDLIAEVMNDGNSPIRAA